MALGEADRERPIVDFANVRRKIETSKFTRFHAQLAAVAALAALCVSWYLWWSYSQPARELAAIQRETNEVQLQADKYKGVIADAAAANHWLDTDVNWLDELNQFVHSVRPQPLSAKDFPVANDAVVTSLTLMRPPGNNASGGRMDITAVAKNPAAVAALETRLRDGVRTVSTGQGKLDKSVPGYDWSFGLDVRVPSAAETSAEAPKK
jgi:hypothetical protein